MYTYSNQTFFFTFPIPKELYIFLKKRRTRLFKLYQASFICKNVAADDDAYLGWGCYSKHFRQNIMTTCYSCYFCIFYIANFFQIIMVSLFLTRHDQYLIMFKHSNVFEVTNLLFQTKYNNAVALFANSKLFIVEGKRRKKLLNQFFD